VADRAGHGELKSTHYELFIILVTALSLVNLVLGYIFRSDGDLRQVLLMMNGLLSLILFIDFAFRFLTARSRSRYFWRRFGWADLLASIPAPELFVLRIFRLVRVIRLLRRRGVQTVSQDLDEQLPGSALLTMLFLGVLVLEFGSLQILAFEQDAPGANITTASDALWYTISTVATVGYGDEYPVTQAGRLCGAIIIIIGVGIFGTFTGYLANAFLSPRRRRWRRRAWGAPSMGASPHPDEGPDDD
jgi:voltage-gated potassium channel